MCKFFNCNFFLVGFIVLCWILHDFGIGRYGENFDRIILQSQFKCLGIMLVFWSYFHFWNINLRDKLHENDHLLGRLDRICFYHYVWQIAILATHILSVEKIAVVYRLTFECVNGFRQNQNRIKCFSLKYTAEGWTYLMIQTCHNRRSK